MTNMISLAEQKVLAATFAVDTLFKEGKIFDGMKIGLGTGSTAILAVHRLSELLSKQTLKTVYAVPTSFQTLIACEKLEIPVYSLNSQQINGNLDLTIDGADAIDPNKNLIKGGGAALLLEKITAYNSDTFVVIADERKKVHSLGTDVALPIEIIAEARVSITHQLEKEGMRAILREGVKKMGPVVTDKGNFILDVTWDAASAVNPEQLENNLNLIPGVVENGLFTKKKPLIFIADKNGSVERL